MRTSLNKKNCISEKQYTCTRITIIIIQEEKNIKNLSLLSLFVNQTRKEERKESKMTGCTSSSAKRKRTRRVMVFLVNNP